jgi:hypothetical protein
VHINDVIKAESIMKRSNIFRCPDNAILDMAVSENGLLMVIDKYQNLRLYDIHHGEKILKFAPTSFVDEVKKQFIISPVPFISGQKGTFKAEIIFVNH